MIHNNYQPNVKRFKLRWFIHSKRGTCFVINSSRDNIVYHYYCFRAMRDAQLKRDKLFKENRKNECKRLRDSNCTTLMLIVVVTVFLMTEIPLAVVTVSKST